MKHFSLSCRWTWAFLLLPGLAAAAPDASVYDALGRFHGHRCGGSILGTRLGAVAKAALGDRATKGTVRAVYYATACPLDGIQVTTGCTLGNGTIEVRDKKEMRLRLSVDGARGAVDVTPTESALALASESKVLSKKAKQFQPGSPERAELEARLAAIFLRLETAPDEELVLATPVR